MDYQVIEKAVSWAKTQGEDVTNRDTVWLAGFVAALFSRISLPPTSDEFRNGWEFGEKARQALHL